MQLYERRIIMSGASFNVDDYKKFIRYEEGTSIYGVSINKLKELARSAGAVYKINRLVLINTEILDDYLEFYHETDKIGQPYVKKKPPVKFIRYKDAESLYSICNRTIRMLAKDAEAVYKNKGLALINVKLFEEYLEQFRL